jgi:hypothetical protein
VSQLRVVHHIVHLESIAEWVLAHTHEEESVSQPRDSIVYITDGAVHNFSIQMIGETFN